MQFTLRQIEIFTEAAKDANFRKTADRLGISQPSVSKHIKLLEQSAGGVLFERNRGSSARLSALGTSLLQEAQTIVAAARTVRTAPQSGQPGKFELRVAAGHYLYDRHLRPSIRELYAIPGMPDVSMISVENNGDLLNLLRSGDADIGFYTGEPVEEEGLVSEVLGRVRVGLFAAPALARQCQGQDALGNVPLIMSPADSAAFRWQQATLAVCNITSRNIVSRSQFLDVMIDQAVNGVGMAILFESDIEQLVDAGKLVRMPLAIPDGLRCMVTRQSTAREPRARAAIQFLRRSAF